MIVSMEVATSPRLNTSLQSTRQLSMSTWAVLSVEFHLWLVLDYGLAIRCSELPVRGTLIVIVYIDSCEMTAHDTESPYLRARINK